jgi:hypothetical protein
MIHVGSLVSEPLTDLQYVLLESERLAVVLLGSQGLVLAASPGLVSATGMRPEKVLGQHFLRFVISGLLPPIEELFATPLVGPARRMWVGAPRTPPTVFDFRVIRTDGGLLLVGEPLHYRDAVANDQLVQVTDRLTGMVQRIARERATTRQLLEERTRHLKALQTQRAELEQLARALAT